MDHNPSSFSSVRIPTAVWIVVAAVLAGGIAIFVFKVAIGTVLSFGLFGFMMLSHLFMHGNHGSHESNSENNRVQNGESAERKIGNQQGPTSGCH